MAYVCNVCGKSLTTPFSLKCHLRIHSGDKPFECRTCNKKFTTSLSLRTHATVHSGKKPFQCEVCNKSYRLKTKLTEHVKTHSEATSKCEECGKTVKTAKLSEHLRNHAKGKRFSCSQCDKKFTNQHYLKYHVDYVHSGLRPHTCHECGKAFGFKSSLYKHMCLHSGEKKYRCEICNKGFLDRTPFKNHLLSHQGLKPCKCEVCDKSFLTTSELNSHKKIHFERERVPCHLCDRLYTDTKSLRSHLRDFHSITLSGDVKTHTCDECGKVSKSASQLKRHKKIHGEKKHMCTHCGRRFIDLRNYKRHLKIHTDDKPFSCEVCQKAFREKQGLKLHKVSHSGEKPFLCSLCGKGFKTSQALKIHLSSHSRDKPNQCSKCGRRYKSLQSLNRHRCPAADGTESSTSKEKAVDLSASTSYCQQNVVAACAQQNKYEMQQIIQSPTANEMRSAVDSRQLRGPWLASTTHPFTAPSGRHELIYSASQQDVASSDRVSRPVLPSEQRNGEVAANREEQLLFDKAEIQSGQKRATGTRSGKAAQLSTRQTATLMPEQEPGCCGDSRNLSRYAGTAEMGGLQGGEGQELLVNETFATASGLIGSDQVVAMETRFPQSDATASSACQLSDGLPSEGVATKDSCGTNNEENSKQSTMLRESHPVEPPTNAVCLPIAELPSASITKNASSENQNEEQEGRNVQTEECMSTCASSGEETHPRETLNDEEAQNCRPKTKAKIQKYKKRIYECKKCDKSFSDAQGFAGHGKLHRLLKKYKCEQCSLSYHTKAELQNHARCHVSGQFGCSFCNKSFADTRYLSKHIAKDHKHVTSASDAVCEEKDPKHDELSPEKCESKQPDTLELRSAKARKVKTTGAKKARALTAVGETPRRSLRQRSKRILKELGDKHLLSPAVSSDITLPKSPANRSLDNVCEESDGSADTEIYSRKDPAEDCREHRVSSPDLQLFQDIITQGQEQCDSGNYDNQAILASIKDECLVNNSSHGHETETHLKVKDCIKKEGMQFDLDLSCANFDDDVSETNSSASQIASSSLVNFATVVEKPDKHQCDKCSKTFSRKYDLGKHLEEIHTSQSPYHCEICQVKLKRRKSVVPHLIRHITTPTECPQCRGTFANASYLKQHMLSHILFDGRSLSLKDVKKPSFSSENQAKDFKFKCAVCSKGFSYKSDLLRHEASHTKPKSVYKFSCSKCDMVFKTNYNLLRHELAHGNMKRFRCNFCDTSFKYSDTLKSHVRKHVSADNQCMSCHMAFADAYDMTTHMLTHTNYDANKDQGNDAKEKESTEKATAPSAKQSDLQHYYCDICNKYLKLRRSALEHVRRHIGENNTCSSCKQSFDNKQDIAEHMSKHARFDAQGKAKEGPSSIMKNTVKYSFNGKSRYVCKICPVEFTRETFYDHHMYKEHNTKNHECPDCGVRFSGRTNLCTHMLIHGPEGEMFPCSVCKKEYRTKHRLKAHMVTHSKERPFPCQFCSFAAKTKTALKDHTTRHTNERRFKCDVCERSFAYSSALSSHKKVHSDTRQYECEKCSKAFKNLNSLKKHRLTHLEKGDRPRPHACEICDKSFAAAWDLKMHEKEHRGEYNFVCKTCGKRFVRAFSMRLHERVHMYRENNYICDVCGKGFKENTHLRSHRMRHFAAARRHSCDQCNKKFHFPNELKKHQITHTGQRPWVCEVCGDTFREKSTLSTHVLRHSGVEKHHCDLCNKSFNRKIYLTIHNRIHTGYKPYSCRFCSKKIRTKTHLTNHERTHTGEKPYKCDMCPCRFAVHAGLVSHKLVHLGIKKYQCEVCNRRFRQAQHLRHHELTHTGTKPHKCNKCNKAFTQKQSLKAHLLTHSEPFRLNK